MFTYLIVVETKMWKDNNQKQKPGFMPYENEDELEDYFEKKYKTN